MKNFLFISSIIFFAFKAFSQNLDTLPDVSNNLSQEKIDRINQENWDVIVNNDTIYKNVRLKYISGDSLIVSKGKSSHRIHVSNIELIKYNGRRFTGLGTWLGILGGLGLGYVFGTVILPPIGSNMNYSYGSNSTNINVGLLSGFVLGIVVGSSLKLEKEEFDVSSMNFTEKIITIRTQIFGLNPY
jgi:hypothetical protein